MRHQVFGKKLNRNFNQRKALYRKLFIALVKYGKIETTEAKAKAVKNFIEKIITKVKKGDLHVRRRVLKEIPNKEIVEKLFKEIGPAFKERVSGFIRIIKVGEREGDGGKKVIIEWVNNLKENYLNNEKH